MGSAAGGYLKWSHFREERLTLLCFDYVVLFIYVELGSLPELY